MFVSFGALTFNKMKSKKYHTVGRVPKFNRKIIETEAKSIPL
jgi:hypothetical protein